MIVGGVVVASLLAKAGCERLRLPPLLAYLLIGFGLRAAGDAWNVLPEGSERVFDFLAKIGVIALLFSVGIKSDLRELFGQFRRASVIWIGNIVISGGLGFLVAWWLGLGVITCIIIAVAMTATSVGVPAAVYERTDAIETDNGQLFVDVAELDDISGVLLLAVLFAVLPTLRDVVASGAGEGDGASQAELWSALLTNGGVIIAKLLLFAGACYLFARFVRGWIVDFFERRETGADAVISITGIGIIIAGVAGTLGFSVAVGAFFAGLAFSSSREAIYEGTPFQTMRDLFVPFFFVGIGLSVEASALTEAWGVGLALASVAIAGKVAGTTLPGMLVGGGVSALVLGVAMIPRAEITMIIMERGLQLGDWAITERTFSAMVVVVLVTCLLAPPTLRILINRHIAPRGSTS